MTISAMKQALQALDLIDKDIEWHDKSPTRKFCNQAAHFLRQAIAEAGDEPRHISYVCPNCHWSLDKQVRPHTPEDIKKIESKWVGLTDEEIKEIVGPWGETPIKGYTRKLFDVIEAKLREKNV